MISGFTFTTKFGGHLGAASGTNLDLYTNSSLQGDKEARASSPNTANNIQNSS
jgi:hypothetical protein